MWQATAIILRIILTSCASLLLTNLTNELPQFIKPTVTTFVKLFILISYATYTYKEHFKVLNKIFLNYGATTKAIFMPFIPVHSRWSDKQWNNCQIPPKK